MSGQELLHLPQNTAALSGDKILLRCTSKNGKGITWSKCALDEPCERISSLSNIVIPDPEGKYSIQNPSSGEFNLQIDPVGAEDAIQYRCETVTLLTDLAYTEVIVVGWYLT